MIGGFNLNNQPMQPLKVHLVSDNYFFVNCLTNLLTGQQIPTTYSHLLKELVFNEIDDRFMNVLILNVEHVFFTEKLETVLHFNQYHPYIKVLVIQKAITNLVEALNATAFEKIAAYPLSDTLKTIITTFVLDARENSYEALALKIASNN